MGWSIFCGATLLPRTSLAFVFKNGQNPWGAEPATRLPGLTRHNLSWKPKTNGRRPNATRCEDISRFAKRWKLQEQIRQNTYEHGKTERCFDASASRNSQSHHWPTRGY